MLVTALGCISDPNLYLTKKLTQDIGDFSEFNGLDYNSVKKNILSLNEKIVFEEKEYNYNTIRFYEYNMPLYNYVNSKYSLSEIEHIKVIEVYAKIDANYHIYLWFLKDSTVSLIASIFWNSDIIEL